MAKRTGFPPILCLVMMLFLQNNGCTSCAGIPSDFNSVVLQATSLKITAGGMVTITASVPRDDTGAGVTWSSDAPPSPGTFAVTSVTVATYTAPNSVASEFTVTVTATSIAFPDETKTITITVEPPANLKITTTTLPNGVVNVPYPAGTQLTASGGVPPYKWSLVTAATTFPTGLTLNSNGTITGTPTATGDFNTFTVMVSDSETPPMTQTTTAGQLSITITNLLTGSYAFEFSGFKSGSLVVVAGSFTSDGISKISGGVEDVDAIVGGHQNQTFTGTFTLTADNRGQLIFSSLPGSPTYDFAINATGAFGRLIEFDSTGVRGSGQLKRQNTTTCASQTLSGAGPLGNNYVIGVSGAAGTVTGVTPGPFAMVGRFTAEVPASDSTPGNIDTGEVDINAPGPQVVTESATFSGTFQTTAQPARCTMSLTQSVSNMTFSVYPVTSTAGELTEAFIVETDTVGVGTPDVTVGKLIQQVGYPFTTPSNTMAGTSVAGLSGNVIPQGDANYLPFVAVAQLTPNGGTGFTMPLVENIAGDVSTFLGGSAVPVTTNNNDTFGRFDTNVVSPISPVFYVIGPNEAFSILENTSAAVIGIFEPQSTGTANSFSTSLVAGTLEEGTVAPDTSATTDFSGVETLTSTGTTTGTIVATQDTSTSSANTPGQPVTGNVTLSATGTTDGSGTFTLTLPAPAPMVSGQFYIVAPTKLVLISTTAGDANPVLIFLGNCETTCED
jgi:large repetitive protein